MELTCTMCDVRPVYTSPNFVQLLDSDVLFHFFFYVSTTPNKPTDLETERQSGVSLHLNASQSLEGLDHFCVDLCSPQATSGR